MKTIARLVLLLTAALGWGLPAPLEAASPRARVVILADMGNEPDEEQQMVHLLVCSNEFDLEGLVAVTGKYLRTGPRPDLFLRLIDGYEKVLPNLEQHARGWHRSDFLRSITVAGQPGYGMADTGPGKSSPGSDLIKRVLRKDDPRPITIVGNAGTNTLAQALIELRAESSAAELARYIAKARVFENGSQDNAGAWICAQFPAIDWIRSNYQTYAWGGPSRDGNSTQVGGKGLGPHTWEPYEYSWDGQMAWWRENIQRNHGALGELYPDRYLNKVHLFFIEGGGICPWLGHLNHGLYDREFPEWGGYGGRFSRGKVTNFWSRHADIKPDEEAVAPFRVRREVSDAWTDPETGIHYDNDNAPVWRWRRATFNDLKARMDWCVANFRYANHHPVAAVNGDKTRAIVRLTAQPGQTLTFDAAGSSDPDPDDSVLVHRWFIYPEAGTYAGNVTLAATSGATTALTVPTGADGRQIHLILEVADQPNGRGPALFDHRRIVIDVEAHP